MNDYKGFTGISLAKIEVSTDNKNWELLHNVQNKTLILNLIAENGNLIPMTFQNM